MPRVVPRQDWGARDPRHVTELPRTPRGFAVHYNGPAMGLTGGCAGGRRCVEAVKGTQNYHMDDKGWSDVAYSFLVCPSCGLIYEGRGWGVRSAANGTNRANNRWHAVMVLIGGDEPITDMAKTSVLHLKRQHAQRYATNRLVPHKRFKATRCPGKPTRDWLKAGALPPEEEELYMPSKEEIADETVKRFLRAPIHDRGPLANVLFDMHVRTKRADEGVSLLRRAARAIAAKVGVNTKHKPPDEVEA